MKFLLIFAAFAGCCAQDTVKWNISRSDLVAAPVPSVQRWFVTAEIKVTNGWNTGSWFWYDFCASDHYVTSVSTKVHNPRRATADRTSLNGMKFHCCHPGGPCLKDPMPSSQVGPWGSWKTWKLCDYNYYVVRFKLQVQAKTSKPQLR